MSSHVLQWIPPRVILFVVLLGLAWVAFRLWGPHLCGIFCDEWIHVREVTP